MTLSLVLEFAAAILAFLALMVVLSSIRVIKEDESGLVIKRFGQPLPSGRIIALNGEAGYQATLLSPGWHFGFWRWQYKVQRVPMEVIQPGEIALVVAADGEARPRNGCWRVRYGAMTSRMPRRSCAITASAAVRFRC